MLPSSGTCCIVIDITTADIHRYVHVHVYIQSIIVLGKKMESACYFLLIFSASHSLLWRA